MNGKGPKIVKVSPRHMQLNVVVELTAADIKGKTDEELAALMVDLKRLESAFVSHKDDDGD